MSGPLVIVMGVAGSGKTTVGQLLAARVGTPFLDADDLHDAAAKAKMQAGVPLTDADRGPWLERCHEHLAAAAADGLVLACSALTEDARRRLGRDLPVRLVYLHGDAELIAERLRERHGHFAGASLLPSQLATLEPPTDAIEVDVRDSPDVLVDRIVAALASGPTR